MTISVKDLRREGVFYGLRIFSSKVGQAAAILDSGLDAHDLSACT